MPKKYKKRKPRKKINKSIYKSNINKQHVKVNVNTGGSIPSISHVHTPAYPNLMDINSTIKGTMQELLKDIQKTEPKPKPIVNNTPLHKFENRNQTTYPLGDILNESNKDETNLFEEYDNGTFINSNDYEDDEPLSIFLKPGGDINKMFESPLKEEKLTPTIRKSQIPVRKTPFKSHSEEKPRFEYIGSEYKPENDEEKEQNEIKKTQQKYAKNHAERIREANTKGVKIKAETMKNNI